MNELFEFVSIYVILYLAEDEQWRETRMQFAVASTAEPPTELTEKAVA